jgi:hypothetical protein
LVSRRAQSRGAGERTRSRANALKRARGSRARLSVSVGARSAANDVRAGRREGSSVRNGFRMTRVLAGT